MSNTTTLSNVAVPESEHQLQSFTPQKLHEFSRKNKMPIYIYAYLKPGAYFGKWVKVDVDSFLDTFGRYKELSVDISGKLNCYIEKYI
jgi:hypothetical protein